MKTTVYVITVKACNHSSVAPTGMCILVVDIYLNHELTNVRLGFLVSISKEDSKEHCN